MRAMEITGGCLCRKVRFRITAEPIAMRLCWCRVCQYFAAAMRRSTSCSRARRSPSRASSRDYRSVADSGSVMHRRFCPDCGTHLFSAAESRPHLIIVRNGALDDTELAAARRHHLDGLGARVGVDRRDPAAARGPAAAHGLNAGARPLIPGADGVIFGASAISQGVF